MNNRTKFIVARVVVLAFVVIGCGFFYWGSLLSPVGDSGRAVAMARIEETGSISYHYYDNGTIKNISFSNTEITSKFEYSIHQSQISSMMALSAIFMLTAWLFFGMAILFWLSGIVAWILMREG